MADNTTEVQKLYVAYFSRPADPAGLAYWTERMATDPNVYQAISASFSHSAEYQLMYSGKSNSQMIDTVYMNLFGRHAEQAGVNYWSDLLDRHMMTIDNVVTTIAAGARNEDLFNYNAKVAVSVSFTSHVDTATEKTAYSGDHANHIAIDFLASVKDLQSAAAAMDPGMIDSVINHIVLDAGTTSTVGVADLPPPMFA
jgi:hypothetical protein